MAGIDARLARRRFERAAPTYARASRLEAEIGARMLARLDYVKLAPRLVLDAGSGPGQWARALARRYRGATVIALDFALAMLARRGLRRWLGGTPLAVCADFARLPLRAASLDLVWSNMALHWAAAPQAALAEFARVLAPGGLLTLSTLGPDTLKELRAAAGEARVHRFADMHDVGDALLACGLADPVIDMEYVTVAYADAATFLADLRASGQTCAAPERPRGLAGRGFRARLERALEALRRDGRIEITYEVIYGHAWKSAPRRSAAGRDIVRIVRAR
ncbi:MAG: methyltransferase domain-containing protein [Burkholderiales bacterium]|nr:methyltransferase domain-containing protein [Burkholderiales bacterium]